MDIKSQIEVIWKLRKGFCILLLYVFFNTASGILSFVYLTFSNSTTYDFIFFFGPGIFIYPFYPYILIIFVYPLSILIFIIPHVILYTVFYQLFKISREARLLLGFVFLMLWFFAGHLIFNVIIYSA